MSAVKRALNVITSHIEPQQMIFKSAIANMCEEESVKFVYRCVREGGILLNISVRFLASSLTFDCQFPSFRLTHLQSMSFNTMIFYTQMNTVRVNRHRGDI